MDGRHLFPSSLRFAGTYLFLFRPLRPDIWTHSLYLRSLRSADILATPAKVRDGGRGHPLPPEEIACMPAMFRFSFRLAGPKSSDGSLHSYAPVGPCYVAPDFILGGFLLRFNFLLNFRFRGLDFLLLVNFRFRGLNFYLLVNFRFRGLNFYLNFNFN